MQKSTENPYPIRMGTIKYLLQEIAVERDRSLHYVIVKILTSLNREEIYDLLDRKKELNKSK